MESGGRVQRLHSRSRNSYYTYDNFNWNFQHRQQPLILFCQFCQQAICRECIQEHQGCEVEKIDNVADKQIGLMEVFNLFFLCFCRLKFLCSDLSLHFMGLKEVYFLFVN